MRSVTVNDVIARLEQISPLALAEEWDNVGLLVGDRARAVSRVMTCLTLTPDTAAEASERGVDLVVVHHPLPFRPVAQLTTDTPAGRLLWELIGARVAVYSAHTAFDSARGGINECLAAGLGLQDVTPLVPRDAAATHAELGSGRMGSTDSPISLAAMAERVKAFLAIPQVRLVGKDNTFIGQVAVACGSGGSFLEAARKCGCDCLVTGETNFHTCLEADASGVGLVLAGHFASEQFAMERLADRLTQQFPGVEIWASTRERDPLHTL